ncbi:hypothetical protein A9975_03505 [Cupriavidus sp. UME77]|nr:hypothetical protein [Cupriavidus sp. UME77]
MQFGGVELGDGGGDRVEGVLQLQRQAVVQEHAQHGQLCTAIGQLEAGVLVVDHAPAEGLALACVGDRLFQRAFQRGAGPQCNSQAFRRQLLGQQVKAVVFRAQQTIDADLYIVEEQLTGVLRVLADLGHGRPLAQARHAVVQTEQGEAARAQLRVGASGHDHQSGVDAVGDKRLLPAQHVAAVAVGAGAGADRLEVAAGIGLGHGDGADALAARHGGEPSCLLGGGAVAEQVGRDHVRVDGEADAEVVGARQFLDHHGGMAEVAAGAEGLGQGAVEQASAARALPQVFRRDSLALPSGIARGDFLGDKALYLLAELFVVVSEDWAHGWLICCKGQCG